MSLKTAKKLVIGICARSNKANGKPMKQILGKLIEFYGESLETLIFSEETIFHDRIEEWPLCDVLISFYSDGFPLYKAVEYALLRKIWCLNDIDKQFDLLNRATIYSTLKMNGVPVPRHEVLWRNHPYHSNGTLEEHDDHVIVNGVKFTKPFVEKPVSSEDHNVRIYYPPLDGGGSQQLFRKKGNVSSKYSSENAVRTVGSYIYEDFLKTGGTDVKVYAVGPNYAHAEARKSPGLDGKVDRDSEGKEARYPVILSQIEKLIARRVVAAFNQTVCGFDLLRCGGKSYVCDVNGFSFVKKSMKYYEDTAQILGYMILQKLRASETKLQLEYQLPVNPPQSSESVEKLKILRCVIAVIRHGDRTPKQKVKLEVQDSRFQALFKKLSPSMKKIKLKQPDELQEILNVTRAVLEDMKDDKKRKTIFEDKKRLEQVKMALELYRFTGINRKVQFRYESSANEDDDRKRLILIVKWGGELTDAGKMQAENLGKAFQSLYASHERYAANAERGFLRLHNTYRHNLKIYASDEGRVKMTAAAFTKGLLALEGGLPSILMHLVESNSMEYILGDDKEERPYQTEARTSLLKLLQVNRYLTQEDIEAINPTGDKAVTMALRAIKNPKEMCEKLSKQIDKFSDTIEKRSEESEERRLYCSETWSLVHSRWKKLAKDFKAKGENGEIQYDLMKIPAIYDSIKYDIEHNFGAFNINEMNDIFVNAKLMADVVVPQQFGITQAEKLYIAQQICKPLVRKILSDVKRCLDEQQEEENMIRLDPDAIKDINDPFRHLRSRIYFTSESHIHPLMNLIRFDLLTQVISPIIRDSKFCFYQLVIMLYEDPSMEIQSASRIHVEIHFSPGTMTYLQTSHIPILGYRPQPTTDNTPSNSERQKLSEIKPTFDDTSTCGITMENFNVDDHGKNEANTKSDRTSDTEEEEMTANSISPTSSESDDNSSTKDDDSKEEDDDENENLSTSNDRTSSVESEIAEFAQNTLNFLRREKDKFLSNQVIKDFKASKLEDKPFGAPALMTTAVIGCNSMHATANNISQSEIIRKLDYFVPPIRSLETLHNQFSFQTFLDFTDRNSNPDSYNQNSVSPRSSA